MFISFRDKTQKTMAIEVFEVDGDDNSGCIESSILISW
jgi:hypothetical protein